MESGGYGASRHAEMDRIDDLLDGEESDSKVYMAVIMQGSRLGVAYYEVDTGNMYVLDGWEDEQTDFPYIDLVKYQVEPAVVYTSTKMEESFVEALRRKVSDDGQEVEVKLLKSSNFSYEQAWQRLSHLNLCEMREDLLPNERIHFLNSVMDLESELQVRAAGGLISALQQELLIDAADDGARHVQIKNIFQLSLNGFLNVDAATYDALHIFQVDKHPSSMGIGKAKEGFSVFGMLNKCVTLIGRRLLRTWFLRPIVDMQTLNDRLDTISLFKQSKEVTLMLQNTLRQVKNMFTLIRKFSSPSFLSTSSDWASVLKSITALVQIRQLFSSFLSSRSDRASILRLNIVQKVFSVITDDFAYLSDLIKGVIDFNQVVGESSDTLITYGICQELDELKTIYEGLPDFLDEVAASEMKKLPGQNRGSLIYIPQVGFFMCFSEELQPETLEEVPDFQLAFKSGSGEEEEFFYHSDKTKELDDVLGDIYYKILDMERAILKELEFKVLKYEPILRQSAIVTAELDCLVSLAVSAFEYNYNRPELVHDNIITIRNGRHPLQEMTVDTFVPNDTSIGTEGSLSVITGPNYSGKSVYIKQVGLIVYLSHIGSFVPADEARIGLTDRIFARLPCKQTVRVPQSTFMTDLRQIAVMLRYATPRSLCLIDEFGSGTISADGIGLLCSALNHFACSESTPKVLACTHFSELSEDCFLPKSPKISFSTMSVLEPRSSPGVADIVFLYRLVPGYQALSYGIYCAELAGVPQEITRRAATVLEAVKAGQPIRRLDSLGILERDRQYEGLITKLVSFDCKNGDVNSFLSDVLRSS